MKWWENLLHYLSWQQLNPVVDKYIKELRENEELKRKLQIICNSWMVNKNIVEILNDERVGVGNLEKHILKKNCTEILSYVNWLKWKVNKII